MKNNKTTDDLFKILKDNFDYHEKENSSPETYKYVIYIRKSTDEDNKQIRSVDDQIAECKEYAEKNNLYVKNIVVEKQSAKEPGIRPKFRKMLDDISDEVYDGLIAWHPDRLARNMKEAGEIIDLLDKKEILDLQFPSFTFENTTSGKMTLGITFVLSKQYSDTLSDNVKRGNKRAILEARSIGTAKHGYKKNKHQRLIPDGNNFILIQNAFNMRLKGYTFDQIANYLNENNYTKKKVKLNKYIPFIWNKKKIGDLLKTTFYTGVLVHGKEIIDLTKLYNFTPVVSVDDFLKINKTLNIDDKKFIVNPVRDANKTKAKLLNGKVFCIECGEKMSTGITTKKLKDGSTKRYFNYRCDTKDCERFNKSTRANVIVDFVKDFLEDQPFSNKNAYEHYKEEMKRINNIKLKENQNKLKQLQSQKRHNEKLVEEYKKWILENQNETKELIRSFNVDLKQSMSNFKSISKRILILKDKINAQKHVILTYSEFLELWSKMAKNIREIDNLEQLDKIILKFFSNFYVDKKNVVKYSLEKPFDKTKDPEGSNVLIGGR